MASLMNTFIFLIFFSSITSKIEASQGNCRTTSCSHAGPDIRYPFRAKNHQSEHCGFPGYDLICKENKTFINFPSFGDLIVKSISYDKNRLNLFDSKNCLSNIFFNLNLSSTPFQYYFSVMNYTYLNCSKQISPSFYRIPYNLLQQVPCQSGLGFHVYIVEASLAMAALPGSCTAVKTVAIPFGYSPYLYGGSFGLALTWDMAKCSNCGLKGSYHGHGSNCFNLWNLERGAALSISFLAIILAILTSIKVYYSWKVDIHQEVEKNHQKVKKFLEGYTTVKPTKYTKVAADEDIIIP